MPSLLHLDSLSLYFGGLCALDNLCLNVDNSAHIHGIIGPNGAGKSTLFNVITGIYKPTQGHVYFNNEKISGKNTIDIVRHGIARTFQNIRLLSNLNVLENLKMGSVAASQQNFFSHLFGLPKANAESNKVTDRAREILSFLDLSWAEHKLPDSLSYGDRRKVEIARALMQHPRLLLLDEPAAGMNPTEKLELAQSIQKIAGGKLKVVVIEHDMKFVMGLCKTVTVLNQGAVIAEGSPEEIQKNAKVIEVYLGRSRST